MEIVFVHTWRACSDGGRKEAAGVGVGGWVEVWGGGVGGVQCSTRRAEE